MIFSFLRSSRAVGRSLALKPSFVLRLVNSRSLPVGASATPYATALVSARARFFATTRPASFAAAAEAAEGEKKTKKKSSSTKSAGRKKTTAKASGAKKKPAKKVAPKKKSVSAKAKKPAKRGRIPKPKPKPARILKKDLRPPLTYPGTSWVNFMRQFMASKGKGRPASVGLAEASKIWKEMSEEDKQAYAPSREAVAEYSQKRKEWLKSLPFKHRKMYAANHAKPSTKGLPNTYAQFTKEHYASAPGTFVEKGRFIKEKWNGLSDAEKEELKQKVLRSRKEIKANTPRAEA